MSRGLWIGNTTAAELEYGAKVLDNAITLTSATGIVCIFRGGEVRGNTVTGTGSGAGSGIAMGAANGVRCENMVIQGNTFVGWNFHGIQSDAIDDTNYTQNITVVNNITRQNLGTGIFVNRARGWVVVGNIVEDNNFENAGSGPGIDISMARQIRVENNLVTDTRTGGARTQTNGIRVFAQISAREVEDITLKGNVVSNNLGDGIQIANSAPGTMTRILIQQNLSTDNGDWGIGVKDATDGDITKVVATGNSTARNVSGDIRMDPSDGVIN